MSKRAHAYKGRIANAVVTKRRVTPTSATTGLPTMGRPKVTIPARAARRLGLLTPAGR
ncbi:hypothetical protein [Ornithinimicrobium sp. W1665]|uniref:hypothetical protein n=1 Tax=Ornithinimicrobium sp. W1665 TaxID=3416666 RepID=UPI003CFB650F